jgi:hypothetical protein
MVNELLSISLFSHALPVSNSEVFPFLLDRVHVSRLSELVWVEIESDESEDHLSPLESQEGAFLATASSPRILPHFQVTSSAYCRGLPRRKPYTAFS